MLCQVKALEWEGEVLTQRLSKAAEERDARQARLEAGVHDVQQKTGEGRRDRGSTHGVDGVNGPCQTQAVPPG